MKCCPSFESPNTKQPGEQPTVSRGTTSSLSFETIVYVKTALDVATKSCEVFCIVRKDRPDIVLVPGCTNFCLL